MYSLAFVSLFILAVMFIPSGRHNEYLYAEIIKYFKSKKDAPNEPHEKKKISQHDKEK